MSAETGSGLDRMFKLIGQLPDQLAASRTLAGLESVTPPTEPPAHVILCGMGGSAIAGDLVQPLLQSQTVPLVVWRDYGLPHWAGPRDLVICASYSGNTEETLSGLAMARDRGCQLTGITSGGKLAAAAADVDRPFPRVALPAGLPPRAALGYGLGALVGVLGRLGLVPGYQEEVDAAIHVLTAHRDSRRHPWGEGPADPESESPLTAAACAALLVRHPAVIYTADPEVHGVGRRFHGQLSENAKRPAFLAALPEADHNDLVGWAGASDLDLEPVLFLLRGPCADGRLQRRAEVTRDLLAPDMVQVVEITAQAPTVLARVLSLVQFGDYVSCHLARDTGVDPVPVTRIEDLKLALAKDLD